MLLSTLLSLTGISNLCLVCQDEKEDEVDEEVVAVGKKINFLLNAGQCQVFFLL